MKKTLFALILSTAAMAASATVSTVHADTVGKSSNSFSLEFLAIGNPGNTNDSTGFGGVSYNYKIAKYDVSVNQLQKAISGGLAHMVAGAWTGDQPANLSWYQAAAFVNWLNTNSGFAPAYNLTWKSNSWSMALWPTNQVWTLGGYNPFRNKDTHYFLASENEYYKAAYYDPTKNNNSGGYWSYPTGSDGAPVPVSSGTNAGTAVYNNQVAPASVYLAGGLSPYGTMGQGGQVGHLAEGNLNTNNWDPTGVRASRGGDYGPDTQLDTSFRGSLYPSIQFYRFGGVRVASVSDPTLVYSLSGTNTFAESNSVAKIIGTGYALSDDTGFGGYIVKYQQNSTHYFSINYSSNVDVHTAGTGVGAVKLYSLAMTDGSFPNVEKEVVWASGTNALIALTPTKSIVAPNTLTAIDNILTLQGGTVIQNQSGTLTIDTTNTYTAFTNNETAWQTLIRLSNSFSKQGLIYQP